SASPKHGCCSLFSSGHTSGKQQRSNNKQQQQATVRCCSFFCLPLWRLRHAGVLNFDELSSRHSEHRTLAAAAPAPGTPRALDTGFNTFLSRFTGKGQQQPPQLPSPSGDSAYSPSRLSSFRKTASASGSVASSASATAVSVSSTGPPVMSELKTFASNYVEDAADDLMLGADEANGEAAPASNSSRPGCKCVRLDAAQDRT
uniref:Os01g0253500 protein n=1 Tax=Macrostomum lignano TaxID=282301 RepID=A0A1I8F4G6_9PLAT